MFRLCPPPPSPRSRTDAVHFGGVSFAAACDRSSKPAVMYYVAGEIDSTTVLARWCYAGDRVHCKITPPTDKER